MRTAMSMPSSIMFTTRSRNQQEALTPGKRSRYSVTIGVTNRAPNSAGAVIANLPVGTPCWPLTDSLAWQMARMRRQSSA